eukprot:1194986-Prorocentrum_minimum.AAC.8
MGTRLAFDDVPFDTPETRTLPKGQYGLDGHHGMYQAQTPVLSRQTSQKTPGTVRFHQSVYQGQQTFDEDYADGQGDKVVPFQWDREEQVNFDTPSLCFPTLPLDDAPSLKVSSTTASAMRGCPTNNNGMESFDRMSPKEAFQLVQSRISPPNAPLCPALHVIFPAVPRCRRIVGFTCCPHPIAYNISPGLGGSPLRTNFIEEVHLSRYVLLVEVCSNADSGSFSGGLLQCTAPRGVLSRHELCDQLVSMYGLDRIVVAQAVSYMDPHNQGINFSTFRDLMQVFQHISFLLCSNLIKFPCALMGRRVACCETTEPLHNRSVRIVHVTERCCFAWFRDSEGWDLISLQRGACLLAKTCGFHGAQAGKEYGGIVPATPRTPHLSSSVQDRRDKRSAFKQLESIWCGDHSSPVLTGVVNAIPPPPLEPEWLPKVFQHTNREQTDHLGPGMVSTLLDPL